MSEKPEAERWSMGGPHPDPFGDWVPYENYERLNAENERLKAERDEAVKAEREACAKVCEPQSAHDDPLTAWKIAAAIRARGEVPR